MPSILITGATGNVGTAILQHIRQDQGPVYCATRNRNPAPHERYFDFEDPEGSAAGLQGIDVVFLLRPPQLADVRRYFAPLMPVMKKAGVRQVVFLSVQGAEKISFIPHAKIEKLLRASGMAWTFLRPSYFMQNLTTTLREGIAQRSEIVLPAGEAPFLWIDADDIGRAAAAILEQPAPHAGKAYTLTGSRHHSFSEVAMLLSQTLGRAIYYRSPGPIAFYRSMRRQGFDHAYTMVVLLLHFAARFQGRPAITRSYTELTGREPKGLPEFIRQNKEAWLSVSKVAG